MKRQNYYEVNKFRDATGTISFQLDLQRGEIIQMPDGYRYAIRYLKERKGWASVDLMTGLIIMTNKSNAELQLWMLMNRDRVHEALERVFYQGKDQYVVKQHQLIVEELSKDDNNDIAPDLKAYIITKGFRDGT